MGEMHVDFLDSYRKFFDRFTRSVDPNDQLPVKVAGYNLVEPEIAGAVADWVLQYLEQRKCPPFLIAHLVRKVVEEVRVLSQIDPISCGFRSEVGDFLSLKLMQVCINKLVEVCTRYQDNAELSTLPPPYPLPPVTSCAIKNSRRSMEDRHVIIHDFHSLFNVKGYGPASYYGVFDGHNGIDAAIYSVSHLHQYLAESPHYPTDPKLALRDACIKTDDFFSMKAQRENLHGGTTAVFALLRPKDRKLYVAWLGDSQAVLVRRGVPLQIVDPHKPDRTDERDRIQGLGGQVLYWGAWRVNGQLAVSRAIGDVEYKPYVTAEPDVEEITLDGTEDFLILACDGLWDFVSERDATNAVYNQLQENPEDLESVSQRLVALSKEHSSQDNISVVVVFLAEPSEVAKRRLMETASPSPFVSQNGSDLYCGRPANGQHHGRVYDDREDFGPETDVDMVDDVLLSPAIAAAKALVHGQKELEDDLERQRQQLSDFDDPADLDHSRDTPTPPAHEVACNTNADNLAESGGEESEEEWNYIPGEDSKPESDTKEQDDMSSQLNPNAAEFVPVSPTKLMMLDDAIISASPGLGFEKSLDDIKMPTELEFDTEIAQRPGDLEITNGSKHEGDYFMRDNFSTLRNKGNDFNVSSTCAELGDDSIRSFTSSLNNSPARASEEIPFDKLAAVQNIEEKVTSGVFEKANIFGTNNDFSNNAFEATNIFGKSDLMTTSVMGLASSPDLEDSAVPGTPKSTIVEPPASPTIEGVSPLNHQIDLDSPTEECIVNTQKSPELISPGDGPGLISGQERTSSSGFESESGAEEGESNAPENSDGFRTEHRRSPPIDLCFKPIQTFSDKNPFGALQSPFSTTSVDQADFNTEIKKNIEEHLESNKEDITEDIPVIEERPVIDDMNFLKSTPSSFISARRSPTEDLPVPFHKLDSPEGILHFEHPPNVNNSILAAELPQSPEHLTSFEDDLSFIKQEPVESEAEIEETSFTTDEAHLTEDVHISHADLDSTEGFVVEENKILQDEKECEQLSKLNEEINIDTLILGESEQKDFTPTDISPKVVEQVLAAFDEIKDDHEVECKPELHEESRESDSEHETKEMKLEFESHIIDSKSTPEDLKDIDDGFEVINKEELADNRITLSIDSEMKEHDLILSGQDNIVNLHSDLKEVDTSLPDHENALDIHSELQKKEFDLPEQTDTCKNNFDSQDSSAFQENVCLLSPSKQTNPFALSDNLLTPESLSRHEENRSEETQMKTSAKDDLFSAIDSFNSVLTENVIDADKSTLLSSAVELPSPTPLSSAVELPSPIEPQATKTVSYQTLTPADEPKLTKSELYVTGSKEEEAAKSFIPEEIVPVSDELVHVKDNLDEANKAEASPLEEVINAEETKHVVETVADPAETKAQVLDEPMPLKSEPVQSQVVTETLITALEEKSEVPSLTTTEVPSSAGTPPPTPAPGLESKDDSPKTDILVAAVAAAGAVAAGSAIIVDKELKKTATGPAKKSAVGVTKKPDPTAKAPAKTAPVKASAAKPLSTKPSTNTKPAGTPTKPTGTVTGVKSGTITKGAVAAVAAKKTTASTSLTSAKPASTAASKPAIGANAKQVPKQLPVNKTSTSALKPSSKPTTPTSKPTTPTMPKSPIVSKSDVKSPPRPAARSTLSSPKPPSATTKPPGAAGEKSAEKKSLANGDIKPLLKKADIPAKKPITATTKPPTTTTRPATAPVAKTSSSVKSTMPTLAKTTTTKTTTTSQPKPKTTTTLKSAAPVPIKRPVSASATKATDKTGKDTVNKQISNAKSAVNGKTLPSKQTTDVKKTDAKVNGKNPVGKPAPIKKPEGIKKEVDNPSQIQEDNVTTTNGFAEHIIEEHESMKVEELVPVIVEGVN